MLTEFERQISHVGTKECWYLFGIMHGINMKPLGLAIYGQCQLGPISAPPAHRPYILHKLHITCLYTLLHSKS